MTISSLFIRRPRLAFVVSTVITIAGLLAITALPVAQFPDIVPPQVRVTATYPGASAEAVEASVAQVIEGQVNGVERMIYMKSTSGGDGSYALTVSFEVGSNPDLNTVNVTNRVNQVLALLPPEVQRLGVTTKKQSSALLQVVAVFSPKGSRDGLFLSNFATITLLDTLRRVPGVGDATLFGPLDYSMRIWLNLDRMSSLDITADDVVKAVQAQNVQAAVGLVGAAPLIDEVGFQLNITTQGRLVTTGEFEDIVVRAQPDGGLVRIKDIARVELGAKTMDSVGRYNGQPAAGIQIYQLPGANALATAQGVRKALKDLEPRFPDDVAFNVMYDTTVFVEATIESVIHTLIEAFVLVAIVVFIFLGNLRATLIPIIAVPVALIGTFAVMLAMGYLGQYHLAAGPGAGDRHRGRRRHRRGRGGRAHPRARARAHARPGDREGDGPGHRADHRHHPGAALGVHPDGLHPRHHRPALQPVRGRGVGVDGDLGHQRPVAVAGAVLADPAPSRQAQGRHGVAAERHRQEPRRLRPRW